MQKLNFNPQWEQDAKSMESEMLSFALYLADKKTSADNFCGFYKILDIDLNPIRVALQKGTLGVSFAIELLSFYTKKHKGLVYGNKKMERKIAIANFVRSVCLSNAKDEVKHSTLSIFCNLAGVILLNSKIEHLA